MFLSGTILSVLAIALFYGSYFFFNQYSVSVSRMITPDNVDTDWQTPDPPLQLAREENMTVQVSIHAEMSCYLYVRNSGGSEVLLGNFKTPTGMTGGNWTFYYHVQESEFYHLSLHVSEYTPTINSITIDIRINKNGLDLTFLRTDKVWAIFFFAGLFAALASFYYKRAR